MKSKTKVLLIVTLATAPILLFFQNCSNGTKFARTEQTLSKIAGGSEPIGNTFTLDPTSAVPYENNQAVQQEIPQALPQASIEVTQEESLAAQPVAPTQETTPVTTEQTPVATTFPTAPRPALQKIGHCAGIDIADILLNVKALRIGSRYRGNDSLLVITGEKTLSADKLSLMVKAMAAGVVRDINLILDEQGNKVLDMNSNMMNLVIPGGISSGLKLQLDKPVSVEAGKSYLIQLKVSNLELIEPNQQKCMLKPHVRSAIFTLN